MRRREQPVNPVLRLDDDRDLDRQGLLYFLGSSALILAIVLGVVLFFIR
jgi:hypothetical protein